MPRLVPAIPLLAALLLLAPPAASPALAQGDLLPWISHPSQARDAARETQRLWVMNFYSPTCPHCQAMTRECWTDPRVAALEASFVFQAVEMGKVPSMYRAYDVRSYPTVVVADFTGREILRVVGNPGGEYLIDLLERMAGQGKTLNEIGARLDARRNDPYAHADLARWYASMGMFEQALPVWSRALRYAGERVPEDELRTWYEAAKAAEAAAESRAAGPE
jgi:thioredoxin-like negative regulator of GroEL